MKNIIIAGLGTMGNYYAHNAFTLKDEFQFSSIVGADINFDKCRKLQDAYPEMTVYHIVDNGGFRKAENGIIGTAPNMASIVQEHRASGLIGATHTNNHLSVIKDTLSATNQNGLPLIRNVLQEKPFGLFEDDTQAFIDIVKAIDDKDIKFSLNSILMFSDIWKATDDFLGDYPNIIRKASFCVYGKDRTQDTRPAHEGVFGTEGTHAIDILRGRGRLKQDIDITESTLTYGDISNDTDIPYICEMRGFSNSGAFLDLEMSLAFDKNYRYVDHHLTNSTNNQEMLMRLTFDHQGEDSMYIYDVATGNIMAEKSVPSNTKLANSMRATFTDSTDYEPYTLTRTISLRSILSKLKSDSTIIKTKDAPIIKPPTLAI